MYCSKCGTPLPEEGSFCPSCGEKVLTIPDPKDTQAPDETPIPEADATAGVITTPEEPVTDASGEANTAAPASGDAPVTPPADVPVSQEDASANAADAVSAPEAAAAQPEPTPSAYDKAPITGPAAPISTEAPSADTSAQAQSYIAGDPTQPAPSKSDAGTKKVIITTLITIAVVAIVGIGIFFAYQNSQKTAFHQEFQGTWYALTDSSIIKQMIITEDQMEYNLLTGVKWLDTTVSVDDYEIISPGMILHILDGQYEHEVSVEFSMDGEMMTCRPSFTSVDDKEIWYKLDIDY